MPTIMNPASDKLNLGCGLDAREGYINCDVAQLEGVDVVHDLNSLPLPFADSRFSHILCQDILEHVDYVALMPELYRILSKGGVLHIRVPHYTSRYNFMDPTHRRRFSFMTFRFFLQEAPYGRAYYTDFPGFSTLATRITFEKKFLLYNYAVEWLVNSHDAFRQLYEATGLCYLFPAQNIVCTLVK